MAKAKVGVHCGTVVCSEAINCTSSVMQLSHERCNVKHFKQRLDTEPCHILADIEKTEALCPFNTEKRPPPAAQALKKAGQMFGKEMHFKPNV